MKYLIFLIFQILILLFGLLSFCSYAFLCIWRRNDERDDEFLPYSWEDEIVYKVLFMPRLILTTLYMYFRGNDKKLISSPVIDFVRHLLILLGCVGGRRSPPSHLNHIKRGEFRKSLS